MLDKVKEYTTIDNDESYTQTPRISKKIYAKAIFDNLADSFDELTFRKGDVLSVIEQDRKGYEGWWLCNLRGRQGLCPGNRLRLITLYDSGCFSPSPASSPSLSLATSSATLNTSISSSEIYENKSFVNEKSAIRGCENLNKFVPCSHNQRNQSTPTYHWQPYLQQKPQGRSILWHSSPSKVITPQRYGDVYAYNCSSTHTKFLSHFNPSQPQQHRQQEVNSDQRIYQNAIKMSTPNDNDDCETYDIPKLVMSFNYDCPKNLCRSPMSYASTTHNDKTAIMSNICSTPVQEDSYDIPRPLNSILHQQKFITPSTSNSSLLTFDCSFSSSSNRSSLANIPDYDIPRRNPVPIRALQNSSTVHSVAAHLYVTDNENNLQGQSVLFDGSHTALRSIQSSFTKEDTNAPAQEIIKELPLELSSALDTLAKLQSESTLAITRFLSFVAPNWRVCEKLEAVVIEVKLAAVRLRTALHDLTEFSEGALGNAMRSEDRTLGQKLKLLVKALKEADKLIHESSVTIEVQGGWTLENLARSEDKTSNKPPDSLEQLIACAQTLIEDVRQTTSFIQGNALLLFKRNIPAPIALLSTEDSNADSVENYDYVSFESKDSSAKKNSELREAIQPNLQKKFDSVIKSAETSAVAASNEESQSQPNGLTDRDKLLVKYYAVQISTHMGNLRQAIDSFLETVEKNQPPKFFIAYGKFVVVSAHNLVTIGDIVHRNVSKSNLKHEILHCTDALSEALKSCVAKSKKAAAHFPSVTAVQEMVDSVVNISHLSFDLKTAMLQAVQLAF